jgi:tRNA threonylcarbamoyladenosine biosynthesis protein TsaB
MRMLVLDASLSRSFAALVEGGAVLAEREAAGAHGQAAALPPLAEAVLAQAVLTQAGSLDAVAVCVGPGSFTGIRTAIALAQGIAMARAIPCLAVTVGEALAAACGPGAPVWAVTANRRGQFFLEGAGPPVAVAELPRPDGPVRLAGDGAAEALAQLLARGDSAVLAEAGRPEALGLAEVAAQRLAGALPPRACEPLYVQPPATT